MTTTQPNNVSEKSLNLPNAITLSRLLLSFVLFAIIQQGEYWLLAAGLFVFAVATDVLDGWIARKLNQMSAFGAFLDPVADKLMVAAALIILSRLR